MSWTHNQRINRYGSIARQCLSKQSYASRKLARLAAKAKNAKYLSTLTAYRCQVCGEWHLTRRLEGSNDHV
jgi:hypothetical protein